MDAFQFGMKSAEELFDSGLALLRSGQVAQTVALASRAVIDFPHDGMLWELLGVASQRNGQPETAREALETATLLKPLDIGARFCLAEAFAATGFHELAVFVYRLVADDPRTPVWLLPRVASNLGNLEEFGHALGVCQLLVLRDANRHEAHFGISFYLRKLGVGNGQALAAIARAHELSPRTPLYRVVYASMLREYGRTEEAYDLLHDLSLNSVHCPHLLHRMLLVFQSVNDAQSCLDCALRGKQLAQRQSPERDPGPLE